MKKIDILNYLYFNLEKENEKDLKQVILDFLIKDDIIPNDPVDRFIFLLNTFNPENIEGSFISNIIRLILSLSIKSSDYNIKIYEKGLGDCEYRPMSINSMGYYLNRSQPITQTMNIRSTMDEAYNNLITTNERYAEATQIGMIRSTVDNQVDEDITSSLSDLYLSQNSSLISISQNSQFKNNRFISTFKLGNTQSTTGISHKNGINGTNNNDNFKVPLPVKKDRKGGFGKFFQENELSYTPLENIDSNKIRFVPDVNTFNKYIYI